MNIDSKILNKTHAARIQTDIYQKDYPHDKIVISPEIQGWFNIHKSIHGINHINGLKDKNYLITPINAERAIDKIQPDFMIKVLENVGQKGTYLNIIKATYRKPTADIILNGKKLETIRLRSGTRQGWSLSALVFNIALKVLDGAMMQEKETKALQIGEENVKLSLFADNRDHKNFTRKLLEMVSSTMWQDKKSTCKTQQFFYTPPTNIQRRILGHGQIPIHSSLQENKTSRGKSNQGSEGTLQ